jgi:hypothetical protein
MSNTAPQFTKNGVIGSARVTAANTSSSGSGTIATDIFKLLTSDPTSGTFIEFVRCIPVATTPTTTTATVMRIFASSVTAGATTNADTFLLAEVALPASAADNSATAVNPIDIPLNFRLPNGWALLATNHAAPAANSNWLAIAVGGDY